MGWCSGTEVFDAAISAATTAGVKGDKLTTFAEYLYDVMKEHDWDCECESSFWDHKTIGPIIGNDGGY